MAKVIGWINVLVSAFGLTQLAFNVIGYRALPQSFIDEHAYFIDRNLLVKMCHMSIILLPAIGVLGIRLLRGSRFAAELSIVFFVIETVWFLMLLSTRALPNISMWPLVMMPGLINGAIAFQIITAYPVLASVLLYKTLRTEEK
jgi:hypothetical protein